MSKVLGLTAKDEIIDYCANALCGKEIHFGQPVTKIGHELVCSGKCLVEEDRGGNHYCWKGGEEPK